MMSTPPLLLVLDYPGRRAEARIADLGLASREYDVRNVLAAPFERDLTASSYAGRLVDRFGPFDRPVTAVLAYCMAAPIAQEVAALLDTGDPIPMILFDGEPSSPEAIEEQFGATVKQFAEQLGATAVPQLDPLTFDPDVLSGRPEQSVEWMRRGLVELSMSTVLDDDDAEAAEEMAGFYLDWLVHLVAAYNAAWPPWGGDVYHIMSRHHGFTRQWPGARSMRAIRVDETRNQLLTRKEVALLVESFVEEITAGERT